MDPVGEVRRVLAETSGAGGDARSEVPPEGPLLVAVSGGRDSLVLLHILRFHVAPAGGVMAVHVDHGMRPGSGADARWLAGLCRAWGVPLRVVRLDPAPGSEAQARAMRYRVLRAEALAGGARRVLAAHHADDQAETILFRILRGTGPRGLAGIPSWRPLGPGPQPVLLVRPLLRVAGSEVGAWARATRLRPREDVTNRDLRYRRNRIRHELLPRLEAGAPGFRRTLLALGEAARGREDALERVLAPALGDVITVRESGRVVFSRDAFLGYPASVRAELLRRLVREGGGALGRSGLAFALEFCASATSGREVTPGPDVRLARDFDTLVLDFGSARPPGVLSLPRSVRVEGAVGEATFAPCGRPIRVWWQVNADAVRDGDGDANADGRADAAGNGAVAEPTPREHRTTFPASRVAWPLEFRGRRPGDRVRLHLGAGAEGGDPGLRKLKKLLGEARVSRKARDHLPLLVDAHGWIIWIPGVWRTRVPSSGTDPRNLTIGVMDASNFA